MWIYGFMVRSPALPFSQLYHLFHQNFHIHPFLFRQTHIILFHSSSRCSFLVHSLQCPRCPVFLSCLLSFSPVLSSIHLPVSVVHSSTVHPHTEPGSRQSRWNYLLLNGLQPLTAALQCFALFIDFYSFCLSV